MGEILVQQQILRIVGATRHNQITLARLGVEMRMTPAQLLPVVEAMRRGWLLSAAVAEGRDGIEAQDRSWWTPDGCGLVSVRE